MGPNILLDRLQRYSPLRVNRLIPQWFILVRLDWEYKYRLSLSNISGYHIDWVHRKAHITIFYFWKHVYYWSNGYSRNIKKNASHKVGHICLELKKSALSTALPHLTAKCHLKWGIMPLMWSDWVPPAEWLSPSEIPTHPLPPPHMSPRWHNTWQTVMPACGLLAGRWEITLIPEFWHSKNMLI